ncbi:MAG: F-type H+-transporting ATPase subunit epsilon [Parcubacteria group bacterium LiPW_39]|nr:MAG: F-type H+-transporting ATPase subunit epsilon [Parcubacteria group bacterium LiPW_39]
MSDKLIKFQIVTPERIVLEDNVKQVTVPTQMGEITVLPGHIPLVAVLKPGEIRAKKDGREILMAVSGGFIEVLKNKVVILADTAEMAEEIDEKRAEEARQRAQKLKEEKRFDRVEFAALQSQIEKELARLKVARKHRHRTGAPNPLEESENNKYRI